MKKAMKVFFRLFFVLSVVCNLLLSYYLYENLRPIPSVIRFEFGDHNIVVYCETAEDITVTEVNFEEKTYKVEDAELHYKDDLFFVSNGKKINLSETGSEAFVINSDGELLYQMEKPQKEISEIVYATPSGKKYHSDIYCAGRTAFETDTETAESFGRKPCSICY